MTAGPTDGASRPTDAATAGADRRPWVVTGPNGRIGRVLRQALQAEDVPVVLWGRREVDLLPGERQIVCELDDPDAAVAELMATGPIAGMIHLAGISHETDLAALLATNVLGTQHALDVTRRAGGDRFVYASSNRVTGFYPVGTTVAPQMPARPDGFYAVAKVAAESLCRLYADRYGLRCVCVRVGRFVAERPTVDRDLSVWVSAADLCRAFLAAMTAPTEFATFYGVSANTHSWFEMESAAAAGFLPRDDASSLGGDLVPVETGNLSGDYAVRLPRE